MKTFKKVLALAVSLVMVFSAFAAVMSVSASAAENGVAYKPNAVDRHYGWGQWAKSVSFSSNGWMNVKDEGRFTQMYQTYFIPTTAEKNQLKAAIKNAVVNYDGLINCDILVNASANTNIEEFQENGSVACQVVIGYRYKDKNAIDDTINPDTGEAENPEGWVSDSFKTLKWVGYNSPYSLEIAVDDYTMFDKDFDEYDDEYSDFEIENVIIQAMNYSVNSTGSVMNFRGTEFKKGTNGLGYIDIDYSPLYIKGTACPEKGTDLGADVEFTPNADDAKAPGTFKFISANKEVPQVDDPSQHDGPYGAGSDIDRTKLTSVIYGDANGDEAVNMKDVLVMRKYIAGWNIDINIENADINSDGSINMKDVLFLRKHLAGQPVAPWA